MEVALIEGGMLKQILSLFLLWLQLLVTYSTRDSVYLQASD